MKIDDKFINDNVLYIQKEAMYIPYVKGEHCLYNQTGTICAIDSKEKILDLFGNIESVDKLDTDEITEHSTFFDWIENNYPELTNLEHELACLYNVSTDLITSHSDMDNWYLIKSDDKDWELLLAHYEGEYVNTWFIIAPNVGDNNG